MGVLGVSVSRQWSSLDHLNTYVIIHLYIRFLTIYLFAISCTFCPSLQTTA